MSYSIATVPPFDKQLKRLAKKYPSLKSDLTALAEDLSKNPSLGTSLGNNCFKIRMSIASKGKGKRGGARIITHVYVSQHTVFLLAIYDKSDISDISDNEIAELLNYIEP